MAERQHLGDSVPCPPRHQRSQPYYYHQTSYTASSPRSHPESSFERLRAQRRYSQEPTNAGRGAGPYAASSNGYAQADAVSPVSPQQPYPHRDTDAGYWGHQAESGLDAIRNPHYPEQMSQQQGQPQLRGYPERGMLSPGDYHAPDGDSHSSLLGLNAAGAASGHATPGARTPSRVSEIYMDDPYQNLSRHQDSNLGVVNPNDIEDDGDDGLEYGRKGPRTSMLSLGSSHKGRDGAAAAGGAVAGGVLGGLVARNGSGSLSNQYAPVQNGVSSDGASGGPGGGGIYAAGPAGVGAEKGEWHAPATTKGRGRKWRLAIIIIVVLLVVAGIVLGVLFGVVFKNNHNGGSKSSSGSSGGDTSTAAGDAQANGDLNIDSEEIQALMNNPDLRKVFPGMDYTPLNTQYPDCLHNPPSQNNVTRDLAVLSQLTNTVRLYGTDCNQTQMLIHAVDQLKLKGKVKIWLGVWQDNNATTNARQFGQMWDILDQYGDSYFKGIIVANEILFRQQMTITSLGALLEEVRANLARRGLSLPVATSDLGDLWTSALAAQSDAIMANIHPFFAGTPAAQAADWTMYFWGNKTSSFLKKDKSMNIISETGWPSQGGTGCGNDWETDCPQKAVAGIDEMNRFMEDWVCRALEDGTEYFWFEAFDEPWKVTFDTPGKEWEDHWGLLDVNRNLKSGLKIPDCGGKRVP
ncbi:hypothetical protein VTK56DRAFT_9405 [Thermocarpiscus australiensis]